MDESERTDEQSIFDEVQRVINGLMRFDGDSRARIYRTVGTFFGLDDESSRATQGVNRRTTSAGDSREPHFSTRDRISPKDFLFQKMPASDVERVTCIAYYLTHHRSMPKFQTTDVNRLNSEAAQIKLSKPSQTVANAVRDGLLAPATGSRTQLSALGEKYVEALPDHAGARDLLSKMRSRRTQKKSGGNNTN